MYIKWIVANQISMMFHHQALQKLISLPNSVKLLELGKWVSGNKYKMKPGKGKGQQDPHGQLSLRSFFA